MTHNPVWVGCRGKNPGIKKFCIFKRKMAEQTLTIPIDKIKADFQEFFLITLN